MKTIALVLLLSLISGVVMASEPGAAEEPAAADGDLRRQGAYPFTSSPYPECPQICPFVLDPVCAVQFYDEFKSFSNECVMERYNCNMGTEFQVVHKGNCEDDEN